MFEVDRKEIDISSEDFAEWDTSCPFCSGSGVGIDFQASWEALTPQEKRDVCSQAGIPLVHAKDEEVPPECCNEDILYDVEDDCEHCDGSGHIEICWNTVWEIGKTISDHERRLVSEASCNVISDQHGEYYLTLGGCGMDMTPYMAYAWTLMGFQWIPLEWIESLSRHDGYLKSCIGQESADKVMDVIQNTINMASERLNSISEWAGGRI